MTFTKYLASIPLVANLLIVYIAYPYISSNQDVVWATQSIIILSFFSMLSAMHYGVPVLIVRSYKNESKLGNNFIKIINLGILFSIFLSFFFLINVDLKLIWLMIFVPVIIYINYIRGLWEARSRFLSSYLARMIIISVLPLLIIFSLSYSNIYLLFISINCLILSFTFYFYNSEDIKKLRGHTSKNEKIIFFAFFVQFLYAFIFIFSDRFILAYFLNEVELAKFVKEFEMIYRFSSPMIFIGSILFPGLSSNDKKELNKTFKELMFFVILWIVLSILLPQFFSSIYKYFSFSYEANFFKINSSLISVIIFFIGSSALGHRIILALCTHELILKYYIYLIIFIFLSSLYAGFMYKSALEILFFKSLIEFTGIVIILLNNYLIRKKLFINKN